MNVKEISPMKVIMGVSIGVAILYSLKLGYIEVATAGLGIFGGYLAKDLETNNDENVYLNNPAVLKEELIDFITDALKRGLSTEDNGEEGA